MVGLRPMHYNHKLWRHFQLTLCNLYVISLSCSKAYILRDAGCLTLPKFWLGPHYWSSPWIFGICVIFVHRVCGICEIFATQIKTFKVGLQLTGCYLPHYPTSTFFNELDTKKCLELQHWICTSMDHYRSVWNTCSMWTFVIQMNIISEGSNLCLTRW
jgi:hypothetical protein